MIVACVSRRCHEQLCWFPRKDCAIHIRARTISHRFGCICKGPGHVRVCFCVCCPGAGALSTAFRRPRSTCIFCGVHISHCCLANARHELRMQRDANFIKTHAHAPLVLAEKSIASWSWFSDGFLHKYSSVCSEWNGGKKFQNSPLFLRSVSAHSRISGGFLGCIYICAKAHLVVCDSMI